MAAADVEILERAFAEVAEGNAAALAVIMDEGVRVYPRPEEPGVRAVYEGLEELEEYIVNWLSQWDDYEFEPVEFRDAGEQVLVVMRERGRMNQSDIELEENFTHSMRLRDGRIVEWRMYDTYEQGLEAVGLAR
jgi:ketosteroid isomerase-like protein